MPAFLMMMVLTFSIYIKLYAIVEVIHGRQFSVKTIIYISDTITSKTELYVQFFVIRRQSHNNRGSKRILLYYDDFNYVQTYFVHNVDFF